MFEAAGAEGVAGAASALGGAAASAAGVAVVPESELADGTGALVPPPLKSVAYQPEPFNWKPAAVTCFLNDGFAQWGQVSSGASDIFCNTSLANPQESHL